MAGLSLTSPNNNMMPPLSLSRNDLLPIQGGSEGFSLPPSSSLSSLSYLHSSFPSPTSHQNSSKFTTGAKSSSSTSTGVKCLILQFLDLNKLHFKTYVLVKPYCLDVLTLYDHDTISYRNFFFTYFCVHPLITFIFPRHLLLPLPPPPLPILSKTLSALDRQAGRQGHKSLLTQRQLTGG